MEGLSKDSHVSVPRILQMELEEGTTTETTLLQQPQVLVRVFSYVSPMRAIGCWPERTLATSMPSTLVTFSRENRSDFRARSTSQRDMFRLGLASHVESSEKPITEIDIDGCRVPPVRYPST